MTAQTLTPGGTSENRPAQDNYNEAHETNPALTKGSSSVRKAISSKTLWSAAVILFLVLTGIYWKHFDNSFHFDDAHTIQDNPFIRALRNVPRFFYDPRTSSSLVTHQGYRPLTSASLALDYWLAGGFQPFHYHLSTFVWFNVQLVVMFLLFRDIFQRTTPGGSNDAVIALGAVAFFALHPVCAETLNYIIQRAEVLSTLGVLASVWAYRFPFLRESFLYLLPALLGLLAKQSALVFAPILFVYVLLFEERASFMVWPERKKWARALRASVPAFALCVAFYFFQTSMDKGSPGGASVYHYAISQPFVMLHYFTSFFLPTHLSADTDWTTIGSIFHRRFYGGVLFIGVMLSAALYCSRRVALRPIAFSICWFFLALLPSSSFVPLAEVMNDHRMFFPFVGLTLGVAWAVGLIVRRLTGGVGSPPRVKSVLWSMFVVALGVNSYLTYVRNEVWDSEESLWHDVTIKSPLNGRGLMNYGLTQMTRGRHEVALDYFERALVLAPQYYVLHINLGIVKGEVKRSIEAEQHFRTAIQLSPSTSEPYYYYARWLSKAGRNMEAMSQLERSLSIQPFDIGSRHLLMQIYRTEGRVAALKQLAQETLKIVPADEVARRLLDEEGRSTEGVSTGGR